MATYAIVVTNVNDEEFLARTVGSLLEKIRQSARFHLQTIDQVLEPQIQSQKVS